jgi:peptide/nickel transport system substrate-binding protein
MAGTFSSDPASAQQGRNVTVVLNDEPVSLDACNMDSSHNGRVVRQNVFETLTEIDRTTGELLPRLAVSWEKRNETTWRFKLRENVRFSDGAPFNAEAAAAAIARTLSKDSKDCSTRTRFFATLALTTTVVDTYTLDIAADQPVPILPTQMIILGMASPNTPKDKLTSNPVGTGPYVFEHYTAGIDVVLKRNANYWGEKPQVEQARFVWRNESSVRASMVKIGEADFAASIAPQEATDPAMDRSYLNSETSWLKIDLALAPLNDKRVRLAMNYAIDRKALVGSLFPKDVIPATQLVIPSVPGHNHQIDKELWPYDPAKAKALLAEAKKDGVPVGKEILLIGRMNFYPNGQETMEAMVAMFAAVGLNVKLQMFEVNQWAIANRRPYAEDRGPSIVQSMHDNDKGDPVFTVTPRYGCEGISSTVCNPELDRLTKVASTLSGPERAKAWEEIFRIIYEDIVADVSLFHMVAYSRVGSRIQYTPTVATNSEIQIAQMKFK